MTKRAKPGEWALKIKELRSAASLTQSDLAKGLGVSQGTISGWEMGDAKYEPSADMYFRLGIVAAQHREDPSWFWEEAETPVQALEAIIGRRLKARKPEPNEVVRVPILTEESILKERSRVSLADRVGEITLPAEIVPNVESTSALQLSEASAGFAFSPGDIVVIDATTTELSQLWDKVLLVHFTDDDRLRKEYWPRPGLFMGRIRCKQYTDRFHFAAGLESLREESAEHPIWIGFWQSKEIPSDPFWRAKLSQSKLRESEVRAKRDASAQLEAMPGCRILGQAVCWFSSQVLTSKSKG